ncbi:PREDICTED: uncharacterized protein LOC104822527 [Tarenaya hassleriana]|uniref:uncharacterized protein LOC104822527 n=1 Tax=Tarenaya hassleriana TaxID=28532 RepID=UPI00053C2F54|nr:PREDICTED: uncharacterized protein LOC104822527 [Tarenaya hassleriana]
MFTEGLDENAINWIKKGSLNPDHEQIQIQPRVRSPLAENLSPGAFPRSPLPLTSTGNFASPHGLPPLKFHGLLAPHMLVSPCIRDGENDEDEDESVASVSDVGDGGDLSDYDMDVDDDDDDEEEEMMMVGRRYDEGEVFGYGSTSKLNRGILKDQNLRIEIPNGNRRVTDGFPESEGDALLIEVQDKKKSVQGKAIIPVSSLTDNLNENVSWWPISHGEQECVGKIQLFIGNTAASDDDHHIKVERTLEMVAAERSHTLNSRDSSSYGNVEDMGTPSAPPIMEIGQEDRELGMDNEAEPSEGGICRQAELENHHRNIGGVAGDSSSHMYPDVELEESMKNNARTREDAQIPYWQISSDKLGCHSISGQYAWQSLVAYDACIRLCLYAWSKGSPEAPEFLRDECLLLRSAFGLHKFLLQPRGVRLTEETTNMKTEQKPSLKTKNVVRKIRVEVKRIRLIPQRKLRSSNSLRSMMQMQMGADYVRQVSSLVKTGMNSLKQATLSAVSEEQFSCFLQLKSITEGGQIEEDSAVCLQPGTGDYHVFFPESEGDALLIEVQDKKKSVQGKAIIPVSSLTDNLNENVSWWPISHGEQECVGKIQLFIGNTAASDDDHHIKSAPVVETLAYDLLLDAAIRAQNFHSRNMRLNGPWKWLLSEFADYYGVSDSYTKLRYLSHVMNMATPTKTCLQLVHELLVPILKARSERNLTRQEKSIFLDCEAQIEKLLSNVFENYKSLDENCPSGLADMSGPMQESASPALSPAVQVFSLLHDILSPESQNVMKNYLETAVKKRCRKHMVETDEYVSSNSEGFLLDSITVSTAYLKMKNLCLSLSKEIVTDIKINNEHVLPSSIDLANISAAVYSTQLCNRLRAFLSAVPPSCPQPHVNELLISVSDFERDLDSWGISHVQGGVDSRSLFHNYIMVWINDMELRLLDRCKAERVPWSGVMTNHSTSPFAEDMYERIKDSLIEYEVVISRWPQYTLILENTASNVERAIVKALEKQYNEILTPLKDSIPKRLNMHVQKLTRRQSSTLYCVPSQLGTFLNTIKRILDVLHHRIEDILKQWAACLPVIEDKKPPFGEQMNVITVMLKTKYKNYLQAAVEKLVSNTQANKSMRLKRILEEMREEDREGDVRERMQMLCSQIVESISNLHDVFTSQIFVASCRLFWDRMGLVVLKFLEGRKENQLRYKGSYFALGILDDTFASEMQRLKGNSLQEKDVEPPRSVVEARSILCRDTTNSAHHSSSFFYV